MPRRRIGQEVLFEAPLKRGSLDEIVGLVDWSPVAARLEVIHSAPRGEASWPPLAMFRALLLAIWHDLSDVRLAEALEDRASFRRFCGFARTEATPERTAFVRFRRELVRLGLDTVLFEEITAQLTAKAVRVKTGTLVDATVVGSASVRDGDARWSGHRSRKAVHGYKAHVGADADTVIVEKISVTPGNAHDGRSGEAALPDDPGQVYADSGYRGEVFAGAVRSRGGTPRVVATGIWANRPGLPGRGGTQTRGLEFRDPPDPLPDREDLRHLEALLRLPPDAMARPRKSPPPDPSHRHRLQPQTNPQHPQPSVKAFPAHNGTGR